MTDNKLIEELEQIIVQCDEYNSREDFKSVLDAKVDQIVDTAVDAQNTDLLAQCFLLILHACYGGDDD